MCCCRALPRGLVQHGTVCVPVFVNLAGFVEQRMPLEVRRAGYSDTVRLGRIHPSIAVAALWRHQLGAVHG